MWTAIAVTCSNSREVEVFEKELHKRKQLKLIDEQTELLVVEDPKNNVGSGGATINALLVITEHLSARRGFSVVNGDCLSDAKILVIHAGRPFALDPCRRAFVSLPLCRKEEQTSTLLLNLDALLQTASQCACHVASGVWVLSSDMLLELPELDIPTDSDVILFTVKGTCDYAAKHGRVFMNENGDLVNILYQQMLSAEQQASQTEDIAVLSGLVYLGPSIVETFLSFSCLPPLDACTYLGYDSGSETIQISLFFDLLLPMCSDVTEKDFVSGDRSGPYGKPLTTVPPGGSGDTEQHMTSMNSNFLTSVRSSLWKELHHFKAKVVFARDGAHRYFGSSGNEFLHQIKNCKNPNPEDWVVSHRVHSFVKGEVAASSTLMNSYVGPGTSVGEDCLLSHCRLDQPFTVGAKTVITGVWTIGTKFPSNLILPPELFLQTLHVSAPKLSTSHIPVLTVFGLHDDLHAPWNQSTFCNQSWQELFKRTGITAADLWPGIISEFSSQEQKTAEHKSHPHSLYNARLFPVLHPTTNIGWSELLWLCGATSSSDSHILQRWRGSWRMNLQELVSLTDLSVEFSWRRRQFGWISQKLIIQTLMTQQHLRFNSLYAAAVFDNQSEDMFQVLDKVAIECDNPGICARALASIADMLGAMAQGQGGLRSGPAANESWQEGFSMLEADQVKNGIELMARERSKWSQQPRLLVRAARHYEGAAQILVRKAVMTAQQFISISDASPSPMNKWVTARCPARIDLAGGWSDTPPITYEHGGVVTDAAVTIDGKKPIGARVRRIKQLVVKVWIDKSDAKQGRCVALSSIEDLLDYFKPYVPAALIKAALICAQIVTLPPQCSETLDVQLQANYGGGFEIHTWSNLPQGSGLGTSSILAGALMGALWTAAGKSFDIASLNHAVLYLEQLLTTGGGWQDQVGGLLPGIKTGHSRPELPLKVEVTPVNTPAGLIQQFNDRLMLVYTGKTRLARNLLQEVVRNWYARSADIMQTEDDLVTVAWRCAAAFEKGRNLAEVGACMSKYWELKKRMAPGCEPEAVKLLLERLGPLVYGSCMAGAGGGGFLYVLLKDPQLWQQAESCIKDSQFPEFANATVHHAAVDDKGLEICSDNEQ